MANNIALIFLLSMVVIKTLQDSCEKLSDTIQCKALWNFNALPDNENCDPIDKKDCKMADFISKDIATCRLEMRNENASVHVDSYLSKDGRCYPDVRKYINIYKERIIGESVGNPVCVPQIYGMKFICEEHGSRCVCDTGVPKGDGKDNFVKHTCRCQWYADYCSVKGICSADSERCEMNGMSVKCVSGSVNQCVANPTLCGPDRTCVELEDEAVLWKANTEKEGDGFACIARTVLTQLVAAAPFCDLKTNWQLTDMQRIPSNAVDICCYNQLICHEKGGHIFRRRPCYCAVEFRKCLLKMVNEQKYKNIIEGLLPAVNSIKICNMDEKGLCDPRMKGTCTKGDLISQAIAHCSVNCRTGPLLPIELRSCRIRQCIPHNNVVGTRVVDAPFHRESSRCDAVKDLPVTCGFRNTRCVCDGKPSVDHFTDRCRCQYWPM